jgi:hypothetical protein
MGAARPQDATKGQAGTGKQVESANGHAVQHLIAVVEVEYEQSDSASALALTNALGHKSGGFKGSLEGDNPSVILRPFCRFGIRVRIYFSVVPGQKVLVKVQNLEDYLQMHSPITLRVVGQTV